ncbi:MAG: 30S ribosomal protein S16 [Gemmatimonadales bacterium]
MAVRIRLRREGRKKLPMYRIVVADKEAPRDGRFIATIGSYRPKEENNLLTLDVEKAREWVVEGRGAERYRRGAVQEGRRLT